MCALQQKQQLTEAITLQSMLTVPLWLLQVSDQLLRHHKDLASLLAAGKWISAPELVHIIDTAWKHAELDLQHEGVTIQTNRQLRDAALASMTFSHLPPDCHASEAWLLPVTKDLACILTAIWLAVRATSCPSSPRRPCTSSCLTIRMHANRVTLP